MGGPCGGSRGGRDRRSALLRDTARTADEARSQFAVRARGLKSNGRHIPAAVQRFQTGFRHLPCVPRLVRSSAFAPPALMYSTSVDPCRPAGTLTIRPVSGPFAGPVMVRPLPDSECDGSESPPVQDAAASWRLEGRLG